ncbi:hypothetical protein HK098_004062 [Nowakowskiella sp. JEL0407]|nr:hypothetical protein HK098_004062 [Nowakowskiella sp. JEL0407]
MQRLATRTRTISFLLNSPVSFVSSQRFYDREKYKQQKLLQKAKRNQEDITFEKALQVFRPYCFDHDLPITVHVKLNKEDFVMSVKGDVVFQHVEGLRGATSDDVILVFAKGEHAEVARQNGAQIVGGEELIPQIEAGGLSFTRCLATRQMFPHVVKIAKILGPKGLMPSPARGSVSDDIAGMMKTLKATSKFAMDDDEYVHMEIGRTGWPDEKIYGELNFSLFAILPINHALPDNISTLLTAIQAARPSKSDEPTTPTRKPTSIGNDRLSVNRPVSLLPGGVPSNQPFKNNLPIPMMLPNNQMDSSRKYVTELQSSRILLALDSNLPNEVEWSLSKLLQSSYHVPPGFTLTSISGMIDALIDKLEDFRTLFLSPSDFGSEKLAELNQPIHPITVFKHNEKYKIMEHTLIVLQILRNFSDISDVTQKALSCDARLLKFICFVFNHGRGVEEDDEAIDSNDNETNIGGTELDVESSELVELKGLCCDLLLDTAKYLTIEPPTNTNGITRSAGMQILHLLKAIVLKSPDLNYLKKAIRAMTLLSSEINSKSMFDILQDGEIIKRCFDLLLLKIESLEVYLLELIGYWTALGDDFVELMVQWDRGLVDKLVEVVKGRDGRWDEKWADELGKVGMVGRINDVASIRKRTSDAMDEQDSEMESEDESKKPKTNDLQFDRLKCYWRTEGSKECSHSFTSEADLLDHIKESHFGTMKQGYTCRWRNCTRFPVSEGTVTKAQAWSHFQVHLNLKEDEKMKNSAAATISSTASPPRRTLLPESFTSASKTPKPNMENTQLSYVYGPNGPVPVWMPIPIPPVTNIVLNILRNLAQVELVKEKKLFARVELELLKWSMDIRVGNAVCAVLGELEG